MMNLVALFLGASLGLSALVIIWGIAWAARPRPRKSLIPAIEPAANRQTSGEVLPFRARGRFVDIRS